MSEKQKAYLEAINQIDDRLFRLSELDDEDPMTGELDAVSAYVAELEALVMSDSDIASAETWKEACIRWAALCEKQRQRIEKLETIEKDAFIFGYQAGVLAMGCGTVRDPREVYEQWAKLMEGK